LEKSVEYTFLYQTGAVVKAFEKIHDKYPGTAVLIFPDDGFKYVDAFERYLSEGQ